MVDDPNPSSAESSNWRKLTGEMKVATQMQKNVWFNNNIKQRTKTTPKGKNRQAERCVQLTLQTHNVRQRISTGLQTPGG